MYVPLNRMWKIPFKSRLVSSEYFRQLRVSISSLSKTLLDTSNLRYGCLFKLKIPFHRAAYRRNSLSNDELSLYTCTWYSYLSSMAMMKAIYKHVLLCKRFLNEVVFFFLEISFSNQFSFICISKTKILLPVIRKIKIDDTSLATLLKSIFTWLSVQIGEKANVRKWWKFFHSTLRLRVNTKSKIWIAIFTDKKN